MYPDLSYLLHDFLGTNVDNWTSIFKMFGLMLAMAFLACHWFVRAELKRKEQEGLISRITKTVEVKGGIDWKEIIYNSIVVGFLAFKIPYVMSNFADFQQDPASVLFSSLGNFVIGILAFLGIFAFSYYTQKKENRQPGTKKIVIQPHEKTGDIIIVAAISGIFGAKVFSIIENLPAFFDDPLGQLFSGSGLTIYGGLIFGILTVFWYVKKLGINTIHMLDVGGPAILLGYAVGRMGCQISGDGDWGIVAAAQPEWWFLPDWLWSYTYPNNVNNDGVLMAGCDENIYRSTRGVIEQKCKAACGMRYCHELPQGVYPTPLYEIAISFIGLGLLWIWRRKIRIGGMVFALYLMYNGIERFFIEGIRVNPRYPEYGFNWSQAQYISVLFVLIGFVMAIYLWKKGKRYYPKDQMEA